MTAFPSLQDLHVLRSTSAPPDTVSLFVYLFNTLLLTTP